MDPLGAFSLACNVLQIVEYGSKVICKAAELYRSMHGGESEIKQLDTISRRLSELSEHLDKLNTPPVVATTRVPSSVVSQLKKANEEVLHVADEFDQFWSRLAPTGKGLKARVECLRTAFRLSRKKDEIDRLVMRLTQARSNLMLAFLLYMHHSNTASMSANGSLERNVLDAVQASSKDLSAEIAGLADQLKKVQLQGNEVKLKLGDFQSSNVATLSSVLLALQNVVLPHFHACDLSRSEKVKLSQIQQRVCASLYFQELGSRRDQVTEAYRDTCSWALSTEPYEDMQWDNFVDWLRQSSEEHSIYWIGGKPGSGKSTLMRYLDGHVQTVGSPNWVQSKRLWIGRYYLWNAGSHLEKSLLGALRTLLYDIFQGHLWAIEIFVPQSRWESAEDGGPQATWSVPELYTTLQSTIERITKTECILLFVDGLDELVGSDADREEALKIFKSLSSIPGVKICISSRPWNIFQDSFESCPQLLLQQLTLEPITEFIQGSFDECPQFRRLAQRSADESESLTRTIIDKASGVFLWVRLVVEELRRELRDGASLRKLKRILDDIPADLDQYFKRILLSIDPSHRREGSSLLQVMLFVTDSSTITWPTRLLHLAYLDEDEVDFVLESSSDFEIANPLDEGALEYSMELMTRRLNSRSMGLLEISSVPENRISNKERALFGPRVTFLHRSLLDFFRTRAGAEFLHSFTDDAFPAQRFLCNVLLANCMTYGLRARKSINHVDQMHQNIFLATTLDRTMSALALTPDMFTTEERVKILETVEPYFKHLFASDKDFYRESSHLDHLWSEGFDNSVIAGILQQPSLHKKPMDAIALKYGYKIPSQQPSRNNKRKLQRSMSEKEEEVILTQRRQPGR